MEKTIKVTKPLNESMGESFNALLDILHNINNSNSDDSIIIDLFEVDFIYPFLILPLATLATSLKNKNIPINFKTNNAIGTYLNTIHFPFGFNPLQSDQWKDVLQHYSTKTYLPICMIPSNGNTAEIRETLISIFENILTCQLKIIGQLKISISYILSETITNIVDHANIESGYIMVQNYPTKDFLDVCIADAGIGILKTYEKFPKIKTDDQALKQAVTGISTKRQAITRGYGISTSRKMLVKGLLGKYFLFSGAAFYYYSNEQEIINVIDNSLKWNGTMLALRIPKNIPKDFNYTNYLE